MTSDAKPAGKGRAPAGPEYGTPSALQQLLGVVGESRWLVAGTAAAVLLLGILYAFTRTPVYEAHAALQVLERQSAGSARAGQPSAAGRGSPLPTDTEIQLLQTPAVLVPVIEALHLNIRVDSRGLPFIGALFGQAGKPAAEVSLFEVPHVLEGATFTVVPTGGGAYRLLGPDGSAVLEGRAGAPAAGQVLTPSGPAIVGLRIDSIAAGAERFELARIPIDRAIDSLLSVLEVRELGQHAGIVRVSVRGFSPQLITRMANLIAETNVRQAAHENPAQAASQLRFLNAQLPDVAHRLEVARVRIASFLTTYRGTALPQDAQDLIQRASVLARQTGLLKARIAQAQAAYAGQSARLETRLHALEAQRTELLANAAKLPQDLQTLVHLQSDVASYQGMHTAMQSQIQALQIAEASSVGGVAIADRALVPRKPVAPSLPLDVAVALVLGLLLGVAAAYGRRSLRRGIMDPEMLEERLGLPVYAMLARSSMQRRLERTRAHVAPNAVRLLAAQEPDDATTQGLRSLRTALQLALPASGPRILAICGLSTGAGKSFVASNLAYLFARDGMRVLLVDADLRCGHLHRVFGWPRGEGFVELLRGEAQPEAVARATELEGLRVITTGALPADAASFLLNGDVGALVSRLSGLCDLVVVAVAPALAASDALLVARHAKLNVLLFKHATHSLRQVRLAQKRFRRRGIEFGGCIMNDVSTAARRYALRRDGDRHHYRQTSGR